VTFRYWKWYSNNQGLSPNNDFWDVAVSNDGGATWEAVEHTNISTNCWASYTFTLAEFFPAPGQVQLRFTASDEGNGSLVEAGVDDLIIIAFTETTDITDGDLSVRVMTQLGQNVPNPFNPRTAIDFSIRQASQVQLKIFDLTGRLVRTLIDAELTAGHHQVIWDGKTESGHPVAAGVYLYRLQTKDFSLGKQMLLVK
jgi:hypothetical protein